MIDRDLEHRNIKHRRDGQQLRACPFAAVENDRNAQRTVDDVLVGDDDAGRIDNEA
jgi:hypothetical protein